MTTETTKPLVVVVHPELVGQFEKLGIKRSQMIITREVPDWDEPSEPQAMAERITTEDVRNVLERLHAATKSVAKATDFR